jgi:hypothetical protein
MSIVLVSTQYNQNIHTHKYHSAYQWCLTECHLLLCLAEHRYANGRYDQIYNAEPNYAEYYYATCHYDGCCYFWENTEHEGSIKKTIIKVMKNCTNEVL